MEHGAKRIVDQGLLGISVLRYALCAMRYAKKSYQQNRTSFCIFKHFHQSIRNAMY